MEKEEIKKKHEKALREAILNVRKAKIHGSIICINRIAQLNDIKPKELLSLSDGEFDISATAEIFFIPNDENGVELSYGTIDFHGMAIKKDEEYTIDSTIIIDEEINTSNLKKWKEEKNTSEDLNQMR